MLDQCWATVYDACPTLVQHWVDVSYLLGRAHCHSPLEFTRKSRWGTPWTLMKWPPNSDDQRGQSPGDWPVLQRKDCWVDNILLVDIATTTNQKDEIWVKLWDNFVLKSKLFRYSQLLWISKRLISPRGLLELSVLWILPPECMYQQPSHARH